jgi:hypothetical protein
MEHELYNNSQKTMRGMISVKFITIGILLFLVIGLLLLYSIRKDGMMGERKDVVTNGMLATIKRAGPQNITHKINAADVMIPSNMNNKSYRLKNEEENLLRTWYRDKSGTISDYENRAVKVGAICLKHRFSSTEIVNLLGPALRLHANEIYYAYAPGRNVFFVFSDADELAQVIVRGRLVKQDGTVE